MWQAGRERLDEGGWRIEAVGKRLEGMGCMRIKSGGESLEEKGCRREAG